MPKELENISGPRPSAERKSDEEMLHESEERYRLLFNEMLVGCTLNEIICDEHGKPVDRVYLEVNPAFERLTGLRKENVIGRKMREVMLEVEPFWIEKYGQVAMTGEPAHFEGYMHAVGKYFDVSVFSPRRGQFATTFVDITEQKRVEQALRESERKFREAEGDLRALLDISAALNSSLDIVSLIDSMVLEAIRFTNAEGGCSGIRTPDGMVCKKYFLRGELVPFEYCWPPGIGWPGWVLVHKVPYFTNDAANDPVIVPEIRERFGVKSGIDAPLLDIHGKVIGFFEVDNKNDEAGFTKADIEKLTAVSEIASAALQNALAYQKLAEAEESVRHLWSRLVKVQDDERRRIGRELHDVTGQVLTAIAMKLGVARRALGMDEENVREALNQGLALTKQCSDDIRTLSYLLHSPVLEEGGLEAALRPYVESFSQRSGIQVELDVAAEVDRLPPEMETALFRIVQQALTNIHLHSGSFSATVRVAQKPDEVVLEVIDEGRGIPQEIQDTLRAGGVIPGVGIASMQERIQQVGGRLNITSNDHGTIVTASVSLALEER